MILVQGCQTEAEIRTQQELDLLVSHLAEAGYVPALRSALDALAESASLPRATLDVSALISDRGYPRAPRAESSPTPEILFSPGRIFVLCPVRHALQIWEIRHHSFVPEIENLAEAIGVAAEARLDGRRVRGMKFEWTNLDSIRRPISVRFARNRRQYAGTLDTRPAQFTDHELRGSELLREPSIRDFMISLSRVKKMLADESEVAQETIIGPLIDCGLLSEQYLLRCREDSHEIASLGDLSQVNEHQAGTEFRCPKCGRPFAEELAQEIYAITEHGSGLLEQSHWMTVWATDVLSSVGLPQDRVGWNATQGSDEIDMVIDLSGVSVFVELKDRPFSLGDAYRFAPRLNRYGADFGVVIATDRIEEEAGQHLSEQEVPVKMIADSNSQTLGWGFARAIEGFSHEPARQLLTDVFSDTNFDPRALLGSWIQKQPT